VVLQVGYQILERLLPFRRVRLVALIVCYALRRKRDSWVRASAGSYTRDRRHIERRTSRFERRVYGIGRLLLPFSELQLRFLFHRVSEVKWCLKRNDKGNSLQKSRQLSLSSFSRFLAWSKLRLRIKHQTSDTDSVIIKRRFFISLAAVRK
jgi:hypothetical protein